MLSPCTGRAVPWGLTAVVVPQPRAHPSASPWGDGCVRGAAPLCRRRRRSWDDPGVSVHSICSGSSSGSHTGGMGCHCVTMPPCHSVTMSPYHLVTVLSCHHVTMLSRHSITVSPCPYVTTSPCHGVTTLPCHHVTMSPHHLVTASLCHGVTMSVITSLRRYIMMSSCHHVTSSPHRGVTMLPCHNVAVSPCYHVIMSLSPCHRVTASLCHHVIMSPCHHGIVSPCHGVIMSQCHHATTLSPAQHSPSQHRRAGGPPGNVAAPGSQPHAPATAGRGAGHGDVLGPGDTGGHGGT